MTLSEIASEVERLRPGTLPKSVTIEQTRLGATCATDPTMWLLLHDDIARAMLIGAMLGKPFGESGPLLFRNEEDNGWVLRLKSVLSDGRNRIPFYDSDHGNDPLLSLFEAFKAACGEVGDA